MFKAVLRLFTILLFLSLSSCAVNPVTGEQDLVLMSEEQEVALGRQYHQEVLQEYRVYDNPVLQDYVQRIGNKLAAKSHRSNLVYRFTLLDSKEVNAFALPGGYIYITRGIMAYLKSEAELAAVLGHEIGHVTARHSVRQYSAQQLTSLGVVLGSIFIPGMNEAGGQLMQTFGAAILRGYGREHELEADRLGAEYLARTDYNPQAMIDVISVLKDQEVFETERAKAEGREPRYYHGVFASHPDNDTRLHEVVGTAQILANRDKAYYVGKEEYLQLLDGLIYGDSPQEGITRGNDFYHDGLNIALTLPEKWNVTNLPDRLLATAPGGAAVIQIGVEDLNKIMSPRQFMIERLGLTNLGNEAALKINGLDAHTGISLVNTGIGRRPTRFTVIYFNNRAYIIAGMTRDANQLSTYDDAFTATARSFHEMTPEERALAQPLHLTVVQAKADTRFATLAKESPLEVYAESQLRLLNGKYPQGEPQAGELLKLIE